MSDALRRLLVVSTVLASLMAIFTLVSPSTQAATGDCRLTWTDSKSPSGTYTTASAIHVTSTPRLGTGGNCGSLRMGNPTKTPSSYPTNQQFNVTTTYKYCVESVAQSCADQSRYASHSVSGGPYTIKPASGGGSSGGGGSTQQPTMNFQVSANRINKGDEVRITWDTARASSVYNSYDNRTYGSSGSQTYRPDRTATFRLTASGPGGQYAEEKTVEVVQPQSTQPPSRPTVLVWADSRQVAIGGTVRIYWRATDATRVYDTYLNQWRGSEDNDLYRINETRTFRYIAEGPGGQTEQTILISAVTPQPTITVQASKTVVEPGESVTIRWSSTNANRVINKQTGQVFATSGSVTIQPTASAEYRLYAQNTGQNLEATQSVSIQVVPKPTISVSVDRASLVTGETATFSYNTTGSGIGGVCVTQGSGSIASDALTSSLIAKICSERLTAKSGRYAVTPENAGRFVYTFSVDSLFGRQSAAQSLILLVTDPLPTPVASPVFKTTGQYVSRAIELPPHDSGYLAFSLDSLTLPASTAAQVYVASSSDYDKWYLLERADTAWCNAGKWSTTDFCKAEKTSYKTTDKTIAEARALKVKVVLLSDGALSPKFSGITVSYQPQPTTTTAPVTQPASLSEVQPAESEVGDVVVLKGQFLATTGNKVFINGLTSKALLSVPSADQTTLSLRLPKTVGPACAFAEQACKEALTDVANGSYTLTVDNGHGVSNGLTLNVRSKTVLFDLADKQTARQFKQGATLKLIGKAAPNTRLTVTVKSTPSTYPVTTDANGDWALNLATDALEVGAHSIEVDNQEVETFTVEATPATPSAPVATFKTVGTYTTRELLFGEPANIGAVTVLGEAKPANTSIAYEFATNRDQYQTWYPLDVITVNGTTNANLESSEPANMITGLKLRVTLTSTDGVATPAIRGFEISSRLLTNAPIVPADPAAATNTTPTPDSTPTASSGTAQTSGGTTTTTPPVDTTGNTTPTQPASSAAPSNVQPSTNGSTASSSAPSPTPVTTLPIKPAATTATTPQTIVVDRTSLKPVTNPTVILYQRTWKRFWRRSVYKQGSAELLTSEVLPVGTYTAAVSASGYKTSAFTIRKKQSGTSGIQRVRLSPTKSAKALSPRKK